MHASRVVVHAVHHERAAAADVVDRIVGDLLVPRRFNLAPTH